MGSQPTKSNIATPTFTPSCLGSGAFGEVYSISDSRANKKQEFEYGPIKEHIFLSDFDHPNIIKCGPLKLSESSMSFDMERGLCDLSECTNFSVERVTKIMSQLLKGVAYMHAKGVLHRDLKPENVLLFPDDMIKIIDLGMATPMNKENVTGCTHTTICQTIFYRSPEVAQQLSYGYSVDMWSCGGILLYLLQKDYKFSYMLNSYFEQGEELETDVDIRASMFVHRFYSYVLDQPPYEHKMYSKETKFFKKKWIRKKSPELPKMIRIEESHPLVDLAIKLLNWDPEKRLTARQALVHPSFREIKMTKTPRKYHQCDEFVWNKSIINDQKDINLRMRSILFDWMCDVRKTFALPYQLLIAAYRLIDEYISIKQIQKDKLQLLGCAAFLVVDMFYSKYSTEVRDWAYISDSAYTKNEVMSMTVEIMNTLDIYELTRHIVSMVPNDNENKRWEYLAYEIGVIKKDSPSFKMSKVFFSKIQTLAKFFRKTTKSKYMLKIAPTYDESV